MSFGRGYHRSAELGLVFGPRVRQKIRVFNVAVKNGYDLARSNVVEHFRCHEAIRIGKNQRFIVRRNYSDQRLGWRVESNAPYLFNPDSNPGVSPNLNSGRFPIVGELKLHEQMPGVLARVYKSCAHLCSNRIERDIGPFVLSKLSARLRYCGLRGSCCIFSTHSGTFRKAGLFFYFPEGFVHRFFLLLGDTGIVSSGKESCDCRKAQRLLPTQHAPLKSKVAVTIGSELSFAFWSIAIYCSHK